jgi:uncharacterized RDD family membrane protein YckC
LVSREQRAADTHDKGGNVASGQYGGGGPGGDPPQPPPGDYPSAATPPPPADYPQQPPPGTPGIPGGYPTPGGFPPPAFGRASGPRAGFWQRFAAAFLDGILLGVVGLILGAALKGAGSALSLVVGIAYFTLLEGGPTGQTVGKKALGIRVVSFETGGPIGYGRGFIRWIGRYVSAIVLLLGYFWMLWDKEKQCWHDKFASDVVVPVSAYPIPPS